MGEDSADATKIGIRMRKVVSILKKIAENLKRTRTCVKVLYIGILLASLLAILNYYAWYLYINTGGLNGFSDATWPWVFVGA
jgi:hypothetical protein